MKIVRPWAAEGDYREIMAPDPEETAELIELLRQHIQDMTPEERIDAANRYMRAREVYLY